MVKTSSQDYWSEYPVTYRAEQIAVIMRWIAAGESGVVIGASGSGKSNLGGFLASRLDSLSPLGLDNSREYFCVRFDINSLPALTVPYFYRGLIKALQDSSARLNPEAQQSLSQLTRDQVNWADVFEVLTLLQQAHNFVIRQAGKKVVWILDRFDAACTRLDAQTLNSLRSLRDQFKSRLCYIVFSRHPLARLRDLNEIDEFHEIVAANLCWVGPMVERDARWVVHQMAERLAKNFSPAEVNQLIEISGGLPAFVKLGCLALAEGDRPQTGQSWSKHLLSRQEFSRNCQEIWSDLALDEQMTLFALATGANETMLDPSILSGLENFGLIGRAKPGARLRIFSPIFETFITHQRASASGLLELHPKTRAVLRDGIPLNIELTSHEDRLLSYLLEHSGEVCQKETLISAIWPDDQQFEGVSDERLSQLIKRLREKIEPDPRRPVYIATVRGRG